MTVRIDEHGYLIVGNCALPAAVVPAVEAFYREKFARAGVVAEEPEPSDQIKALLRDLTDPDDCWFDHHGGCQAHGYLSLQPGEKCPHAEAKELLASWVPVEQEGDEE
jgi:hypothetical protein